MSEPFRQILGIRFFAGTIESLVELTREGGLVAVPSAPVLVDLAAHPEHREAIEGCDFAITDSSFMVMLWTALRFERLPRISGLRYLRALLETPDFRAPGATFWIMPTREDSQANRVWLESQGIAVSPDDCYLAPLYGAGALEDPALLAFVESRKPRYIVMGVGGGVQERLGFYLRRKLSYKPAILCTGAAIAFLSGRQVPIPVWADRLFLGWLLRVLSDPKRYGPRFWKAAKLPLLILRHGRNSVSP